ncbi:MAG: hypothetical protein D3909_07825 [Candidatus Electrothrix sp. ATG1]|nr:hypothetical protein [Candidatus Electrothrix sp. ATG1]
MKISTILIIIAVAIVLVVRFKLLSSSSDTLDSEIGTKSDIPRYIASLLKHGTEDDFLIIEIENSEDFFQFKNYQNELEIDFPLVTDRQKTLESKVRQAFRDLNLEIIENKGSGDIIFLDSYIKQADSGASTIVQEIFKSVFGLNENTKLVFRWTSFALIES